MAGAAAEYEYRGRFMEAWQRISTTKLQKKIVQTWSRRYVGINGQAAATELLTSEMMKNSNVEDGEIFKDNGGMWVCEIEFKQSEWVDPPVYKKG